MKEKLKNPYQQLIEERQAKSDLLKEETKKSLDEMQRHTQTATQIGHDGRVDEAIMLTFLQSLLESTINSYKAVKTLTNQNKINFLEQEIKEIKGAKEHHVDTEKFQKLTEDYQVLYARKSVLTHDLEKEDTSLGKIEKKAKREDLETINKKLIETQNEIKRLDKKFKDGNFDEEFQKIQAKYFGEKPAKDLKDLRCDEGEASEKFEAAGFNKNKPNDYKTGIKAIIGAAIRNQYDKLMEKANQSEQSTQTEKMA